MFLALDSDLAHEVDPLILYDAFHPSRSVAIYDYLNDMTPVEIVARIEPYHRPGLRRCARST